MKRRLIFNPHLASGESQYDSGRRVENVGRARCGRVKTVDEVVRELHAEREAHRSHPRWMLGEAS